MNIKAMPRVLVYGGVFSIHHWRDIPRDEPYFGVIVLAGN